MATNTNPNAAAELESRYAEAMYTFGQVSMQILELETQLETLYAQREQLHKDCIGLNGAMSVARSAGRDSAAAPNPNAGSSSANTEVPPAAEQEASNGADS